MENFTQTACVSDDVTLLVCLTVFFMCMLGIALILGLAWFHRRDVRVTVHSAIDSELEDCQCSGKVL